MKGLSLSNKKGQVNTLAPAIMALLFAAIVLVFGIIMSQELRDVDTLKNIASVTNESGAYVNTTGYTLTKENGEKTDSFSATAVWVNVSGIPYLIPSSNYTLNSDTGVLTNLTIVPNATQYNDANVSYTYKTGEEAWDVGNKTVAGLGSFADFWEIIILAIVITVVIGLLLVVFGGRSKR